MKLDNLETNVSSINAFLLNFKKHICSHINVDSDKSIIILWKIIMNNRNTFDQSRCFAKTSSGNQCKRTNGHSRPKPNTREKQLVLPMWCDSEFCGLHYSGEGAHSRKRNETLRRFYDKDNQTILSYILKFKTNKQETLKIKNLRLIYIKDIKYYIDSYNGDIYREINKEYIKLTN